jgi:hypothetical protein
MRKANVLISILLASILLLAQVLAAFAAPPQNSNLIIGNVQAVTLETDPNTGITTVLVDIKGENGKTQTFRISLETAESADLGLVTLDENGNPVIVDPLPASTQIDPTTIISEEKHQNPVASAIVTFFSSSIPDLDYTAIIDARTDGNGFGVIVQALFLTEKLGGDAAMFQTILEAKRTNNFEDFQLDDGTTPTSWAQFRKAVADKHLGIVMSHNHGNNSDNGNANKGNSNRDRNKDKLNNGNGNGNNP